MGKLYEHMVHDRLSPYLEDNEHLSNTMCGFRPSLSTQNILLQMKEVILGNLGSQHKSAILTLHVKGTFDNVTHQAILQGPQSTRCGEKIYVIRTTFSPTARPQLAWDTSTLQREKPRLKAAPKAPFFL